MAVAEHDSAAHESPKSRRVIPEPDSRLRNKRVVDVETAEILYEIGWRQAGPLEGLLWCLSCKQPTIWKDQSGTPMHLLCSGLTQG